MLKLPECQQADGELDGADSLLGARARHKGFAVQLSALGNEIAGRLATSRRRHSLLLQAHSLDLRATVPARKAV